MKPIAGCVNHRLPRVQRPREGRGGAIFIFCLTNNTDILFMNVSDPRYPHAGKEAYDMYAIVRTGGKQYKVREGDLLTVEKLGGEVGQKIAFDDVLLFSDGETVNVGQPVLDSVSVKGEIVEQRKAKKIIVFKYKRRKRYRRKQGHRQRYTTVRIDAIEA
jgi:large subunit ribosomal protein L21